MAGLGATKGYIGRRWTSGSGQVTHHDPAVLEAELLERGLVVDRHRTLRSSPCSLGETGKSRTEPSRRRPCSCDPCCRGFRRRREPGGKEGKCGQGAGEAKQAEGKWAGGWALYARGLRTWVERWESEWQRGRCLRARWLRHKQGSGGRRSYPLPPPFPSLQVARSSSSLHTKPNSSKPNKSSSLLYTSSRGQKQKGYI
jgi:hypothetical protein